MKIRDAFATLSRMVAEKNAPGKGERLILFEALLSSELQKLSDRQLSTLLSEHYGKLHMFTPESVLVNEVIDRLRRSTEPGRSENEVEESLSEGPPCPGCGYE